MSAVYGNFRGFKKVASAFCVAFCLAVRAFSLSVVVVAGQSGAEGDLILDETRIFESSVMDFLFESGLVVSDEPIFCVSDAERDFTTAIGKAGASDCIVEINVKCAKKPVSPSLIEGAEWAILCSATKAVLFEGDIFCEAKQSADALSEIRQFGSLLASDIFEKIKKVY